MSKDKSIVISKADKGDAVVIQDRIDYENKLLELKQQLICERKNLLEMEKHYRKLITDKEVI